jgi:hypothetical protein
MMESVDWSAIVSAVTTAAVGIWTAWFTYNQKTKDKLTDLKIEQYKKDMKKRSFKRSEDTAKVLGALNKVLLGANADRVYIVQPHPLGHIAFLSIQFEVKANGVQGMRYEVQKLEMSDVPKFCERMVDNLWMYIDNIDEQVQDPYAKALLSTNGTQVVAIKRMSTARDSVGSIFCEFIDNPSVSQEEVHKLMHEAAINIQYILPEYQEED